MWRKEKKYDSLAGYFLNIFERQKMLLFFCFLFFKISPRAQLAYKIYPPNLNTVKISFCKVAVPPVKFAIKDLKTTENRQNKATLPIFSTL